MDPLKTLRDKIQNLEKIHQKYILKIFCANNVPYTENSNGVFINMINIPDHIIEELYKYLNYVNIQENFLVEGEVAREAYKQTLTNANKNNKDNKDKSQYLHS